MSAEENRSGYFVAGGTVPADARSYVVRDADRSLLNALRAGKYCYVLTSRQMGKSSLSVRTIEALRREGMRTAFVDLTRVGGRNVTPDQWYAGLLGEIGRGLGDRSSLLTLWKSYSDLGPMQRFFSALREAVVAEESPLVVFIDEIDATKSLPFSTDEFFAGIRECFNRRVGDPPMARLSFCLLGVAIPSDLMSDSKLTPFNVGERIVLRDFSALEAADLAEGLGTGSEALIDRILYWTDGHPFLSQSLGRSAAEKNAHSSSEIDRMVQSDLFEARARETNINLADVGNRILNGFDDPDAVAKYRADILSLYDRILKGRNVADDESNRLIAVLKLAGLVKVADGRLRVRNRIYRHVFGAEWIKEHMPDQEFRRQRRAFRKGALRTAALAAVIVAAFGFLAVAATRSADEAKRDRDLAAASEKRALLAEKDAKTALGQAQSAETQAVAQSLLAKRAEAKAVTQSVLAREATVRERAAKLDAQRSADLARRSEAKAKDSAMVARAEESRATDLSVKESAARNRAEQLLYASNMQLTGEAFSGGSGDEAAEHLAKAASALKDASKSWEFRHYRSLLHEGTEMAGHTGTVGRVAFAPNGDLLTVDGFHWVGNFIGPSPTGVVRRWSPKGRLLGTLKTSDLKGATGLAASPEDGTVAVTMNDGSIQLRNPNGFRIIKTVAGHGSSVQDLELSEDGRKATGWFGQELRAIDLENGSLSLPVSSWGTPTKAIKAIPFPDGDFLMLDSVGSSYRFRRMGNRPDGHGFVGRWQSIGFHNTCRYLAISKSGKFVAFSDFEGDAQILDAQSGKELGPPIVHAAAILAIAFSPDENRLATASADGVIKVTDCKTVQLIRTFRNDHGQMWSLAFSRDGETLGVGTADGYALRYNLESFEEFAAGVNRANDIHRRIDGVIYLSTTHDGKLVAKNSVSSVPVLDGESGMIRYRLPFTSPAHYTSVALSADGRTLVTSGSAESGGQSVVRVWDVARGKILRQFATGHSDFASVWLDPKGDRIFASYGGGFAINESAPSWVEEFNLHTGARIGPTITGRGVVAGVRFSQDGRWIFIGWQSGQIDVLDANTQKKIPLWKGGATTEPICSLAVSRDGRFVATGGAYGGIDIFDSTGRRTFTFPAHTQAIEALAFTPDGKTLLTASWDRTFRMWNRDTWQLLGTQTYDSSLDSMAMTDDGSTVFIGDDRGEVHALRASKTISGGVTSSEPDFGPILAAAINKSKARGVPLLAVGVVPGQDFDRVITAFLDDPRASEILRRNFEVFKVNLSSDLGNPKASTIQPLLALEGNSPKGYVFTLTSKAAKRLSGNGIETSFLFRNDLSVSEMEPGIEQFIRMIRAARPTLTPTELSDVKDAFTRIGQPVIAEEAALRERAGTEAAGRLKETLALVDHETQLHPSDWGLKLERVRLLLITGDYSGAEDELKTIYGSHPSWSDSDSDLLVLEAVANDVQSFRETRSAMTPYPTGVSPAMIANSIMVENLLAPATREEAGTAAKKLEDRYSAVLNDPDQAATQATFAILLVHADLLPEAELYARRAEKGYTGEIELVHLALALTMAREGRIAEAKSALAAADKAAPPESINVRLSHLGNEAFLAYCRIEIARLLKDKQPAAAPPRQIPAPVPLLLIPSLGMAFYFCRRLLS